MRILVVEDDASISELMEYELRDDGGHDVRVACNGAEALTVLAEWTPNVVLLDMLMPVMDGWAFAREYREREAAPAPIVVMSATADAAERAKQISAAGVLAKPFDLRSLHAVVRRYQGEG